MAFTWDSIKIWTYDELYTALVKTPEAQVLRRAALEKLREFEVDRVTVDRANGVEPILHLFLKGVEKSVGEAGRGYGEYGMRGPIGIAEKYILDDHNYHWVRIPDSWVEVPRDAGETIYRAYVGPGKLIPKIPVRCREDTIINGTTSRKGGVSLAEFISEWIKNSLKGEIVNVQKGLKQQVLAIISDPDWLAEYSRLRTHYAIINAAYALKEYRVLGPEILQEALNLTFIEEVHEA
jgi:hypothetical protein